MIKRLIPLAFCVAFTAGVAAQPPERGPAPRELRPQWQRMLAGADADRAAELKKQMAVAKPDEW